MVVRILNIVRSTEKFFNVGTPDKGYQDIGEDVGRFVEVLSGNVTMRDPTDEREGLEGEDSDNLTAKVGADHIDDCYHEYTDYGVAFERREGHLLTQVFELTFHC